MPNTSPRIMGLANKIQQGWQRPTWLNYALYPVSLLYLLIISVRRALYRLKIKKSSRLSVPVIVVGNISVGGTGKTPVVMALVEYFKAHGRQPGVVSRGYGGQSKSWPRVVNDETSAREVGDEPLLIFQHCRIPVMVGSNRVASGRQLIGQYHCDIIISDDGFQHYALERDLDIVVVDGRGFGNGWCLPAGPLREPVSGTRRADIVVDNGKLNGGSSSLSHDNLYKMTMKIHSARQINDNTACGLDQFVGRQVHAVAGIGHPQRFFDQLREWGLDLIVHPFGDHHNYKKPDLEFGDDLPVLMTEKDAVKCRQFLDAPGFWSVPLKTEIDQNFYQFIEQRLS